MPYKKGSIAEQNAKVRKTAKRRIARLEKEIARSDSEKDIRAFRQQIDTIREQISRTYQRDPMSYKATGYTNDELRMARQNLERTNAASKIGTSSQDRKNFLTQQELNMASRGSDVGEFTKEQVSFFYAATQEAWEKATSTQNRNQLILAYFGEKDLRELVRKVLKALDYEAEKKAENYEYGNEGEVDTSTDQSARATSADWIAYVERLNKDRLSDILAEMDPEEPDTD